MRNPPGRYKDADPAHRAFGRSADSSLLRKRRYAEGGEVEDDGPAQPEYTDKNFNTQLSPDDENKYQDWKAENMPHDSGRDYDLRGAFKEGDSPTADTGHLGDKYKKPTHPSFSTQSQNYKYAPDRARVWKSDDPNETKSEPAKQGMQGEAYRRGGVVGK
jgi:hypothetical protein